MYLEPAVMRGKHDLHLAIAIQIRLQPSVLSESHTAESPDTDKGRSDWSHHQRRG